jgi:hypothetical protein
MAKAAASKAASHPTHFRVKQLVLPANEIREVCVSHERENDHRSGAEAWSRRGRIRSRASKDQRGRRTISFAVAGTFSSLRSIAGADRQRPHRRRRARFRRSGEGLFGQAGLFLLLRPLGAGRLPVRSAAAQGHASDLKPFFETRPTSAWRTLSVLSRRRAPHGTRA